MIDEDFLSSPKRRQSPTIKGVHTVNLDDKMFRMSTPLATGTFDGSRKSFAIALGNVTANRDLREYGLHSLQRKLDILESCFDELKIDRMRSVVVFHRGDWLIRIINSSPTIEDAALESLYLDVHDLSCEDPPHVNATMDGSEDEEETKDESGSPRVIRSKTTEIYVAQGRRYSMEEDIEGEEDTGELKDLFFTCAIAVAIVSLIVWLTMSTNESGVGTDEPFGAGADRLGWSMIG